MVYYSLWFVVERSHLLSNRLQQSEDVQVVKRHHVFTGYQTDESWEGGGEFDCCFWLRNSRTCKRVLTRTRALLVLWSRVWSPPINSKHLKISLQEWRLRTVLLVKMYCFRYAKVTVGFIGRLIILIVIHPQVSCYCSCDSCGRESVKAGFKFYENMREIGLPPTVASFNVLIKALLEMRKRWTLC